MNKTNQYTIAENLDIFSKTLWYPEDIIELRPLPPASGQQRWVKAFNLPDCDGDLFMENAGGANIYAGIVPRLHEGGTRDEDCADSLVLWVDADNKGCEELMSVIEMELIPTPTLVLNSGNGAHAYWRLKDKIPNKLACELSKALSIILDTDGKVANPSRIMRVPGFLNHKTDPGKPTGIEYWMQSNEFDIEHLSKMIMFKLRSKEEEKRVREPMQNVPTSTEERAKAYISRIPNESEGGRNMSAYKVACSLTKGFSLAELPAWELLKWWNQGNTPPLAEHELLNTFKSAMRNANGEDGSLLNDERFQGQPGSMNDTRRTHVATIVPSANTLSEMRKILSGQKSGLKSTVDLPWPRISDQSRFLRPGTVGIFAGPPNTGKTFALMTIAMHIHVKNLSWKYLPLEDNKSDFLFRALAILTRDYRMIDDDIETVDIRGQKLTLHKQELELIQENVFENPRLPVKDMTRQDGRMVVPKLPYSKILDWIEEHSQNNRVIFIDPLSQIDFDEQQQWKGEQDFVRSAVGLTSSTNCTVVLSAHTVKRPGKSASLPLTIEDIQGSAQFGRLCQCVLMLDAHDEKTSNVRRGQGVTEAVKHNRTITIARARWGKGARTMFAIRQDLKAPHFEELGVIAPKER